VGSKANIDGGSGPVTGGGRSRPRRPAARRRSLALASLAFAAAGVVLAVVSALEWSLWLLAIPLLLWLVLWASWTAIHHRGVRRLGEAAIAAAALAATVLLVAVEGRFGGDLLVLVAFVLSVLAPRVALRTRVDLPAAPRPLHPVLFFNPASGGGKARRFHLDEEARARGIEPIELRRGDDLRELVEAAIAAGADALAMAGGDGSQAIVAAIAAERDLPYACVPAGTRNHFALDLGVDREDVVGGLDALVDGGERRVDLAEVNGRVFVNNVSLGLYADAVQRDGYRDAKLRTLLEVAPEELGSGSHSGIRWEGSERIGDGGGVALLVSNDPYRLGTVIAAGTRPRLDTGTLGIAAIAAGGAGADSRRRGGALAPVAFQLEQWSRPTFEVGADGPVAAGIDGEASTLEPPIHFVSRPRALRVRIARGQPGASPSTQLPHGLWATLAALVRIALGRDREAADDLDKSREGSSDGQL
jgi:Diacylglycerol kinase catalytic domain